MLACTSLGQLGIRTFLSLLGCISLPDRLRRLKPLDIEVMKRLGTRVNLIPVVAKADTLTQTDLQTFKQRVRSVRF